MSDDFTGTDGIEPADAVRAVRDEPFTAAARKSARGLRCAVGDRHPECTVEARRDQRVKSGVRVWTNPADTATGTGRSTARTHRAGLPLRHTAAGTGGGGDGGADTPAGASVFVRIG